MGEKKEIPAGEGVHFDYCFLRSRPTEDPPTAIVASDRTTQGAVAHVVPKKGTQYEQVRIQLEKDARRFGYHGRIVVESDSEPAVKDLMDELARRWGGLSDSY